MEKLPVTNYTSLQQFETELQEEEFFQSMISSFLGIGGKDMADFTRTLMSKIICHELALECNWSGRNNKDGFMQYVNILKLILAVLQKNPITRNATQYDVTGVIKVWLRTAADRHGGRSKRRTESKNNSN
ncbi:hypothetical protein PPYR_02032 [Photinus pyralis]|uniref:DUF4806 domain-containing protein n=1 Tax=Photinus pyralis TaxID=7054 RepID=A0A5N4B635_PHOPY|nr:hypothetical protein PPYR_02032 [Photinus pyralis]